MGNQKNTQQVLTVPSMINFEIDEVFSILIGVNLKSNQKAKKQKSSINPKIGLIFYLSI